jgi:hypothetical protein
MLQPIWKDYIVDLGEGQSFEWNVGCEPSGMYYEIYNGKAWARPGESSVKVKINDICQNFLRHTLPLLPDYDYTTSQLPITFYINKKNAVGNWVEVDSVEFAPDWSYDYAFDYSTRKGLSLPINGHVSNRQYLFWTNLNGDQVTAKVTLKSGESFNIIADLVGSADVNLDFNDDFSKALKSPGMPTIVIDLSQWDIDKVTINDDVYKIVSGCPRYCLYYINAYGGWDSFLIEGSAKESDSLTRQTFTHVSDNSSPSNRGVVNHLTEITKRMTLNTSWLSDEEAGRMHNLLNSTEVYLHDLERGEIIPVVLKNGTTEYKTYRNNGGKLVDYSIEVEFANKRVRR